MNANPNPEAGPSEYYPRRARWYSRFLTPVYAVRRTLHLEKIHLPSTLTLLQLLLGLIVPGYAFLANGRRIMGWGFVGAYGMAGGLFIVALGYQLGNLGYGLMISAHASSIIFLEGHWMRDSSGSAAFAWRFGLAVITLLVVWLAIYSPAVNYVEENWVVPLRVREKVVVMRRLGLAGDIQRGDAVMYSIREGNLGHAHGGGGAVWVREGFGWGPVLAVAGDRVAFTTNAFLVNDIPHPLLPHMPTAGELVVPEKHWFIWPELAISNPHNAGEANISALMLQMATVAEDQFVGKPFKSWFGRRQIL